MMGRKLRDSVVVITGASGGIGRETALEFARRGAFLVLAARRESALHEVASECRNLGSRAVPVPTDVTDEGAVRELARRAVGEFGRLDVWVNNASITMFGRFEESPPEAYRRVIETNLFGYINGARAALPYFREQGSGTLINLSSMIGVGAMPLVSSYVASKFGIRGFSESLREELAGDNIHVCTILPASIDTPLFQQGANFYGWTPRPMPPVYDAGMVARAIVDCAESPRREVIVGGAARTMTFFHGVLPGMFERSMARSVPQGHFQDEPAEPTMGNLFQPMPEWARVSGGWKPQRQNGRMGMMRLAAMTGVAVASAVVAYRVWQDRRRARLTRRLPFRRKSRFWQR